MSRALRTILLWVMALAMPVQGMAASVMQFCGPGHARVLQGFVPAERQGTAVHDHGPGHHHPAVGSVRDPATPAAHSAAVDEPSGSASAHHGKYSCSACAACCSMMAMPSGFALPLRPELASELSPSPPVPVQSHLPDGLDRPPRVHLA